MKKIPLLITLLFACALSFGQNAVIKGTTLDTTNKQKLPNTVVTLLRAKDSVLIKFTRSNAKGDFELKNIKVGSYILFVTYPEYADYAEAVTLADTTNYNNGPLSIIL